MKKKSYISKFLTQTNQIEKWMQIHKQQFLLLQAG
jgi:hypothetical protein